MMNGLKSIKELALNKPCGTRLKYLAGCKCLECKKANSAYQQSRVKAKQRGEWNGIVPADTVRKHLKKLSKHGIGYKTVADYAAVSSTTLSMIISGKRKNLRKLSERAILQVDKNCINDKTLISVNPTLFRVNRLKNEGFTESELAKRLHYKTHSLQLCKCRITARKALKIKKFYDVIFAGDEIKKGSKL